MTIQRVTKPSSKIETASERAMRLAHERMLIEEAQADLREGRLLDDAEFDAWLDKFETGLTTPSLPPKLARSSGR